MSQSPGQRPPTMLSAEEKTPVASTAESVQQQNGNAMEVDAPSSGPPSGMMGPPGHAPLDEDSHPPLSNGTSADTGTAMTNGTASGLNAAVATSSQQPKVVQTAFIHKLYSMLQDTSISHLISWTSNNESFVMSPSAEFGKTLAHYFKHTNISSFVRQLNMYGFHKVSDVFHTGSPDSTLWEFRHGNGNFRRGDLAGLREIKRRASRHALNHREPYSSPNHHKPSVSHPGTPAEPAMDPAEARLVHLEQNMFDLHARLMRTEESNTALSAKCHVLNESLVKAHQWSLDLTHLVSTLTSDPDHPVRRDASMLEKDITRQVDMIRNYEDPHESLLSGRQPYFANMALAEPASPRAAPVDERRPSLHAIPPRSSNLRPQPPPPPPPPPPSQAAVLPQRRYGSVGTAQQPLPNYHRPFQPQMQIPPPNPVHPLANVSEPGPNLGRRHTSADIRVPGWPPQGANSSPTSGQSSGHWPSSPTTHASDQHVRDQLASYEFGRPRQSISSHHGTPPSMSNDTTPSTSTLSVDSNWSWAQNSKFAPRIMDSAPQTRRSSMASNVHSLLNPAETVERDEEDPLGEERKRKRLL